MSESEYLDLLEELERYDYELEQLSKGFSDGFYQLSRANYHNKDSINGGKYGSLNYDMNYEGQLYVDTKDGVCILKKTELEQPTQKEGTQGDGDDDEDNHITNRNKEKIKPSVTEENQEKNDRKGPYDPIKMFAGGFIVPRQLRLCQNNFQSSMTVIQDLINRRNKINQIIDTLELAKA